jgi:hypothetical protein
VIGIDAGAEWASPPEESGRVRAVFSRAVHLDVGRVLVVVDGRAPAGPLHLRVDALPAVEVGDEVVLAGGRLELGTGDVDLWAVPTWTPPTVGPRWRYAGELPGWKSSALALRDDLLGCVEQLLAGCDLDAVAGVLGGLGPGLTPAGDDMLAGIVLTLHTAGVAEARLATAVAGVRSTDLSMAALRWAARGHSIEPAHAVLVAVAAGDDEEVVTAARRLCAHGATSGADLLLGIQLALTASNSRSGDVRSR